eukprot:12903932-Prorocentrum_lima.AAC.1
MDLSTWQLPSIPTERLCCAHLGAVRTRGVLVASVYSRPGEGLSLANWHMLTDIGAVVRGSSIPFVIGGDGQVTPQQ